MVEPTHAVMRGKALQGRPHTVHGRFQASAVEIDNCNSKVIAVVKFILAEQAALQAVDQRENFGISHLLSKGKTPTGKRADGRSFVYSFRVAGMRAEVKSLLDHAMERLWCEKFCRRRSPICAILRCHLGDDCL